jgi:alanine racemase
MIRSNSVRERFVSLSFFENPKVHSKLSPKEEFLTWVEIDLNGMKANVHFIIESTQVNFMAIIKAAGYGHGAVQVAKTALEAGATWLGVARVAEVRELRRAGIEGSILILGWCPPARLEEMIEEEVSFTFWNESQLDLIAHAAKKVGKRGRVHLKVDTGMSRVGTTPEEGLQLARLASLRADIDFEGAFTHFARAEDASSAPTDRQLGVFQRFLAALDSEGLRPRLIHSSNSAATLCRLDARFDLVRVGIAMYGLNPSKDRQLPDALRPVLSWKSRLIQVKTVPPGRGISYGHIYRTKSEERIGTVPVGYADGFRRVEGGEVLIRGTRVPVVGRVTMDQIMVQLDSVPSAEAGDEVVIIGEQGNQRITADDLANLWGTVNYEVTCGISNRLPRVYLGSGSVNEFIGRY